MKLRYYLRGIGLGIIVAAAICMCATINNKKTEMTDAQIKARAEELGMIDSKLTLSDAAGADDVSADNVNVVESPDEGEYTEAEPSEIAVPEVIEEEPEELAEEVAAEDDDVEIEEAAVEEAEEEPEEAAEVKEEIKPEPTGDIITIVVDKGNGSDTVARKLADAGLVPNAGEYDKYLMANGYDRRIAAGTHKIPKGASDEEIAKLLVSKQD